MSRTDYRRGPRAPGFLLAAGLFAAAIAVPTARAAELPTEPEALVETIRAAIEAKDYEALRALVYWEGAGKIKQRIVRFQLNRGLGRKIRAITFEPFPKGGFDGVNATGKLAPNMDVTNRVRVVYDEPVIETTGKRPTAVFLVGKIDGAYRIGLVNRKFDDDDDD